MNQSDEKFMREAIKEARKAELKDEVPIGAVLVKDGKILARGHNIREIRQNSLAHAEILAIHKGCRKLKTWRLEDCTLYVTLEPCPMCAGAILQSRIERVVYGASDPKGGSVGTCFNLYDIQGFNHYPAVEGELLEDECAQLLRDFFKKKRKDKKLAKQASKYENVE